MAGGLGIIVAALVAGAITRWAAVSPVVIEVTASELRLGAPPLPSKTVPLVDIDDVEVATADGFWGTGGYGRRWVDGGWGWYGDGPHLVTLRLRGPQRTSLRMTTHHAEDLLDALRRR